jgi:probable rRNA maturation factor
MVNPIVEVNNCTDYKFSRNELEKVVAGTIELGKSEFFVKNKAEVSIALVGPDEMRYVNAKYREKDTPTDVLSFAEFEDMDKLQLSENGNIFLGEVILCPSFIESYASKENLDFEKEFFRALSHGILHILGYPHGEAMFAIQDKVAEEN